MVWKTLNLLSGKRVFSLKQHKPSVIIFIRGFQTFCLYLVNYINSNNAIILYKKDNLMIK
jgi:hypothetical protein